MIKSGMGTIRSFEFEEPITQDDLPEVDAKIAYIELNGEGFIEIKTLGAVDDTYHPEASPGPQDSHYLFEKFAGMMI